MYIADVLLITSGLLSLEMQDLPRDMAVIKITFSLLSPPRIIGALGTLLAGPIPKAPIAIAYRQRIFSPAWLGSPSREICGM